ncbi:MAG: hypothetical protein ACLPY2_15500 [Bryobacteraceae bacterium]
MCRLGVCAPSTTGKTRQSKIRASAFICRRIPRQNRSSADAAHFTASSFISAPACGPWGSP